jgi:hypothetical protein
MTKMLTDGVSKTRICTAFYRSTGNYYTNQVKPFLDQIENGMRQGQGGAQ